MELPIPIVTKEGNIFNKVEILKPKPSVIADTKKVIDTGEVFQAIRTFLGGCIESISNDEEKVITDKINIKGMLNLMPYRSAEVILYKILVLYDPDKDAVEGVYTCPRCGFKVITELVQSEDLEIDTRDYISQLDIRYMEEYNNIVLELSDPVTIKNKATDEVIDSIEGMELRHPTLADCIIAEKKYGDSDSVRMQFAMYVEALLKVNGKEVDKKFKNTFGIFIFENIREVKTDLGEINRQVSQYGLDPFLTKKCKNCQKEFEVPISMSNFFVSGLTL